jgi:hypothetical protein
MRRVLVLLAVVVLAPFGASCALFGSYFAWKFFGLYLPNKPSVDACVPSGGTCSIDGVANLELSGTMMALWLGLALVCFLTTFFLLRAAHSRRS